MQILYSILFVLFIVGPIFLAWLKGDDILDALASRRHLRRQRRRQRSTRALPVRQEVLATLLEVDRQRDRIDARIGESLSAFRQLLKHRQSTLLAPQDATSVIDEMEQILLTRESYFSTYIDIAWLQSETLEQMTQEVKLLRELAELPVDRPVVNASFSTPAAERLLQNLDMAARKRSEVDRKLDRIGSAKAKSASSSGFDVTIE